MNNGLNTYFILIFYRSMSLDILRYYVKYLKYLSNIYKVGDYVGTYLNMIPETTPKELTAADYIKMSYKNELNKSVLVEPITEYRDLLGKAIWLVPSETAKTRIKAKDDKHLIFTGEEFFLAVQLIAEQGKQAWPVLECYKMFGGSLSLTKDAIQAEPEDNGRDISPDDSPLWLELLKMSRAIDIDFAARLLYLRGAGCRLVENDRTGFKIVPIIDDNGRDGWESIEQYNREKWCLNPYKQKLTEILKALRLGAA